MSPIKRWFCVFLGPLFLGGLVIPLGGDIIFPGIHPSINPAIEGLEHATVVTCVVLAVSYFWIFSKVKKKYGDELPSRPLYFAIPSFRDTAEPGATRIAISISQGYFGAPWVSSVEPLPDSQ